MRGEEGYSRFFAYTNLFIASMVVLVLADNLLLMYLGWEGVGLCSYLLIGFYYTDPKNGAAAMKAFVVTRVGDVFLAFALFILYNELGTLNFREMVELAPQHFANGSTTLQWATLMLLGGAVGKSAQLPLQTWLADAMAGPTPVTTESMVSDRPSNTRLKPMLKSPTDIQVHSGTLTACLPLAKKSTPTYAVTSAARPTEPMPTAAERFSDQRPREKASSTKPINGKRMVKASMFIHATHLLNRCSGSGGDDGAAAAAPGRYSLPQPRG